MENLLAKVRASISKGKTILFIQVLPFHSLAFLPSFLLFLPNTKEHKLGRRGLAGVLPKSGP
jgi:hypothetical protein